MTPNEITDLIAAQVGSVNDFVFKRTVLARADVVRAQQLKRTLDKNPQDRSMFTQELRVDMETYNTLAGTDMECIESRSKCEIPSPVRANSMVFDYVGAIDGSNPFRESNVGTVQFLNADRWGKKVIHYRYVDPIIYVKTAPIPQILVIGIFENPEEIYNITAKARNCKDCDYWESEYPCSADLLDIIINEVTRNFRTKPVNEEVNGTQNKPDPTA